MKAVISNRIVLHVDKALADRIVRELTYKIHNSATRITGHPEIIKTFQRISPTMFSIPAGRTDLIPSTHEIIDKRVLVPVEFPELKFSLRESQQQVYDSVDDFAIVNAPVSWGKTFTAIALAAKLSQKTLVVTHTTMLRDQWIEEIYKVLGIRAGIIGSGKFDLDSEIVVANIQTLAKRISEVAEEFGTLIVDEAHHCPSSTFTNVVDKSKARYKIGLTGTLERKDAKHVLFRDYFGSKVLKPKAENYMVPEVVIVKTQISLPECESWAEKVTQLETYNEAYRRLVVELADSAANQGHRVLVVGARVSFLETAAQECVNKAVSITGSVKDFDSRKSLLESLGEDTKILFGTYSIFAEGISQNDLSCLILATPINNDPLLTQLIGRIVRLKEGKKTPVIIDINLKGGTAINQARNRLNHYIQKGYRIRELNKSS